MKQTAEKLLFCLAAAALAAALLAGAQAERTHAAYLTGFPDGTVRPEEALTREQLCAVLYRLSQTQERVEAFHFQDVAPGRWSFDAIAAMTRLGIVLGGTDGCFRPEQAVTWRELICVLDRIAFSDGGCEALEDVAAGWTREREREPYLRNGQDAVSRAELASLMNRLLGRTLTNADQITEHAWTYADNRDPEAWYYLDILEAGTDHTCRMGPEGEYWTGAG